MRVRLVKRNEVSQIKLGKVIGKTGATSIAWDGRNEERITFGDEKGNPNDSANLSLHQGNGGGGVEWC